MPLRGLEHVVEGDRMHQDPSIGVEHRDPRPVLAERGPYQVVRLRDAPDSFPQRFSAAIEEGGGVITGWWERRQGGSWEPDIDVTYRRAIWLSIDHVRISESLTTAPKYPRECVRSVDWYQPRS
jgi:protein-L-isoaspartate O-methyltransferase